MKTSFFTRRKRFYFANVAYPTNVLLLFFAPARRHRQGCQWRNCRLCRHSQQTNNARMQLDT
eukprot:scaffold160723_cov45-Attheya_sp.AAC.3